MRKRTFVSLLTPLLLLLLSALAAAAQVPPADAARPELRAFWVDGFNDGFHTPAECDALLARARAAHLNALFVQMRKRGDAYYQSHYEPWATDDPQHFDALAYLCAQAHTPGLPRLQIHAWVNACAVSLTGRPNDFARTHPDWLSLSDTGATDDGESIKIDPGDPAAADWTYRVYLDIVRHYPVDGIHFDFIRYGGAGKTVGHWGYNPVSIARFDARYGRTGQPLWDDPLWQAWRREQVTALVRRVSVTAHALKPHLIVSAATICWGDGPPDDAAYEAKSASYTEVYAPWRDWLREGLLDLNCPMTYFSQQKHPDFWQHWAAFIKDHQYGHVSAMGVGAWINTVPDTLMMVASTRAPAAQGRPAAGVVLYDYVGTDTVNGVEQQHDPVFYGSLPQVFPADVPPPPMPWLDAPTTGGVMGTVLRGAVSRGTGLTPADGVIVTVQGPTRDLDGPGGGARRTVVCDGNGFFACTGLPPGAYSVSWPGDPDQALTVGTRAAVTAGRVTEIFAGDGLTGVTGIGVLPDGRAAKVGGLVTNGSDRLGDDFYMADGLAGPTLRVHAPGLAPPTVAGDRVAVSGTLRHTAGGTVLDATVVRQVGAVLVGAPR